jgi:hypothetical protein
MTGDDVGRIGRHHPIPALGHLLHQRLYRLLYLRLRRFRHEKAEQFRLQPVDHIGGERRRVGKGQDERFDRSIRRHDRGLYHCTPVASMNDASCTILDAPGKGA